METTTQEGTMTFNQQLIQGLWKIRNREYPGVRDWLRQCIELERKRVS